MASSLLSTKIKSGAFNSSMLILRIFFGVLMMKHGYQKLVKFNSMKNEFMNFLGLGSTTTLLLVIFAELFCAFLIVLGLFTRFAAIPLIILTIVALFMVHKGLFFSDGEMAALYLGAFLALFIAGPGKISVDGMIGK